MHNNTAAVTSASFEPTFIPKVIFFDIDDTLSRNGVIAPHNQATLERLAETNVKLVIATGRSKSIIPQDIMALLESDVFDAIVCTNGQYSFDKKGVISHYPLTLKQANIISELCVESGFFHKFDSDKHLAWANNHEKIRAFAEKNPSAIIDPHYHKSNTVYQCSVFFKDEAYKMQDIDFGKFGLKLVHWHQVGGDILPLDASKARGIADVCSYFDIAIEDAMAIGDGFNDLEMFDAVGYSVAMGDAQPALKKRADWVTGSIEEHGIQAVLEHLIG